MKIKLEKLALVVKDMFKIDIGGVSFDANNEKQDNAKENPQIKDKNKDKKQLQ